MQQLFEALMTHLADKDISSSLTGMFNGEAPKKQAYPYGTYEVIGSPNDFTYDGKIKTFIFKFVLFSDSKSTVEINSLYGELMDALDEQKFDVDDWGFFECEETNSLQAQFKGIRHYDITFEITLTTALNEFLACGSELWDLVGI